MADEDDRYLLRREWEEWRSSVYEYRHTQMEKEIASIVAVMNRLESVTGHLEAAASTARSAAETAHAITNSWWTRGLGISVVLSPLAVVVVTHYWK